MWSSKYLFLCVLIIFLCASNGLREFRSYSTRPPCEMAVDANYPFAYSKYFNQSTESKGRVNSNFQDFRHTCYVLGGQSKCNSCNDFKCNSASGSCFLQLQGVKTSQMSINIPTVSDTSWAVGGRFRHDYGGPNISHYCVFTSGGSCIEPYATNFSSCAIRCFGYGFTKVVPRKSVAQNRTLPDVYPGMGRWLDDGQVDLWEYPSNCTDLNRFGNANCSYHDPMKRNPSFNPQGYTFTLAGGGKVGFVDGHGTSAEFYNPEDVALDENGILYVADTKNHAIRRVTNTGDVTTIAGRGPSHEGYQDGNCSVATFSFPKGLDVRHEKHNGKNITVILVADTGNHRIRKITITNSSHCVVTCLSGLCGNNELSATDSTTKAYPISGYSDGTFNQSRFSAPESVTFMEGNWAVVADTGNFLLRWVSTLTGDTSTLAGNVVHGETDADGNPLAGCTPPCMRGQQGYRDGNLSFAQFYNPLDVTRGPDNTVWVADEHRIRIVELPSVISVVDTINSEGRVSTIAGTALQGHDDDIAQLSNFFNPTGVFVTSDNIAYVADSTTCRIRRVTPMPKVAEKLTCHTRGFDIIRPSGCTSFDQPIDEIGRKVSRVEANVMYNYRYPYELLLDQGKYIKNCVGVPPLDRLDKHFISEGDNLVIDDHRTEVNEDSEAGVAILVECPSRCYYNTSLPSNAQLLGNHWYAESSSICEAAIHDGVLTHSGGLVQVLYERRDYLNQFISNASVTDPCATMKTHFANLTLHCVNQTIASMNHSLSVNLTTVHSHCNHLSSVYAANISACEAANSVVDLYAYYTTGVIRNGIKSHSTNTSVFNRVFSMIPFNVSNYVVHTVAGRPSAPLQSGCGYADGQPSLLALFSNPSGIASHYNQSLSDHSYLYVADTDNNRIRGVAATCTQICENGGRCTGPDTCTCPSGWSGIDCTKPLCTSQCGKNKVCVGPGICACKPGYSGTNCDQPLCVQTCVNGYCSAPDTCTCTTGWFDSNCTTPVCTQTCANGGNCIGPDTCDCPSEWDGVDCRIPHCNQKCHNNGKCVAPNTCACPPQWSNYDCSAPVCTQGYFQANKASIHHGNYTTNLTAIPTYKNCDIESWCAATNEFECDQLQMTYGEIVVPNGPQWVNITGRLVPPTECMHIELPLDFKIPYKLILADNSTTGDRRYSPRTPYESNNANRWRGYYSPVDGHTGPWNYTADRQVAFVNWLNVSQGIYVCANGGSCIAPDVCSCAEGWIGFDCRTPVCGQGYYKEAQTSYVSGLETSAETTRFEPFMFEPGGNQTADHNMSEFRLQWPYSNPNFSTIIEYYESSDVVVRQRVNHTGVRYLSRISSSGYQGGYRCTVRADTHWEHEGYSFSHPNFYSLYMDNRRQADGNNYTHWLGMEWPPTHRKSRILDFYAFNRSFAYTNEGWRRYGTWNRTVNPWQFGVCIMEFSRNCSDDSKTYDIHSGRKNVYVQDTDLSYRPRLYYDDLRVTGYGRWKEKGGQCVDQVIRGCANNGTCVAPGVCECAKGWESETGSNDCRKPICRQTCLHNGNCTSPNVCTCERGWTGDDCSIPMCAQECQNGGLCVAPDTCKCNQWPNTFRDGRVAGGRPLFQDEDGDPLNSGWTGYDCSVPICVQAEKFLLNVAGATSVATTSSSSNSSSNSTSIVYSAGYVTMGGHGADSLMACTDTGEADGITLPRCPQYDLYITANDGVSFQQGCGWDPFETGCCIVTGTNVECYKCSSEYLHVDNHTVFCSETNLVPAKRGTIAQKESFKEYLDYYNNFKLCGNYSSPRDFTYTDELRDYGVAKYYKNLLTPTHSNFNYYSNWTSNKFLCNVQQWVQGDYIDDAGLSGIVGAGSIWGLSKGRHIRINTPNIISNSVAQTFTRGAKIRGEGVYECYNAGSCIGPDTCTCTDGYEGDDCNTPLCRHLQPSGAVTSCLNDGICISKDVCNCVQTESVLWNVHPDAARGITGWTGTDCSMPMCVQGYYDPFCSDLPQAPGGEGCYRCANRGNCTAPDVCTCAEGWTGFDCRTPVCEVVADPLTRTQLGTISEEKVISFESDPCGVEAIYGVHGFHGTKYARGNCTKPNECTCLCKVPYNRKSCHKTGKLCDGPWQDPMVAIRNLLIARGPEYTFGSSDCKFGYEGNVDSTDHFTTCHQTIYVPTSSERDSIGLIVGFSIACFFVFFAYRFASQRLRKRFLLAKIERRRSKRSSEESLMGGGGGGSGSGSFVGGGRNSSSKTSINRSG